MSIIQSEGFPYLDKTSATGGLKRAQELEPANRLSVEELC